MRDLFASPKRRLNRADNRISELEDIFENFWSDRPYSRCVEFDPDRRQDTHSFRFSETIPDIAEDVSAEALLALRSCLDQAGYAAALASGKMLPTSAYFPVTGGDASDLDNLIRRRCVDLPDEIKTLFRGFNAHKGGNRALCVLNELRNAVHTVFTPTVVYVAGRRLNIPSTKHDWLVPDPPIWDSAKNEIVYLWTDPGAQIDYNAELTLTIAFADIEDIRRSPAVDILWWMFDEVEMVLLSAEAECRRLGWI